MDKVISALFLIACVLCAAIVNQANINGSVLIAGMFTFFLIITAVSAGIFWKIGKGA